MAWLGSDRSRAAILWCQLLDTGRLAPLGTPGTGGLKLACPRGVSGTQECQMPRNAQTTS